MTTLLKNYIKLLENKKKSCELMGQLILGIIQEKIEGHDKEKVIFLATLKRIPYVEKPDELQKFVDEFFKPGKTKVHDVYGMGRRYHNFSSGFKKKIKDLLYMEK